MGRVRVEISDSFIIWVGLGSSIFNPFYFEPDTNSTQHIYQVYSLTVILTSLDLHRRQTNKFKIRKLVAVEIGEKVLVIWFGQNNKKPFWLKIRLIDILI